MRKILTELSVHSLAYLVGSIAISASSILLLPLYTRYLTKSDYGVLEIMDSLNSVLLVVFMAGLSPAMGKFHNESITEAEKKEVLGTSFWFVLAFSSFWIAILAFFRADLARVFLGSENRTSLMTIGLLIMWVNPVYILATYVLNVHKMPGTFLAFSMAKLFVNVLFNLYFIVDLGYGAKGMLLGELFSTLITGVFLIWLIVAKNGLPFNPAFLRKALMFGLPFVPAMLCAALMHRADRYLLQSFGSLEAVGIYGLGYKLPFMLGSLLLQSFGRIWSSSAQFEIAKQDNWREIFSRVTTYFFTIIVVAEFSLAILSTTVLKILTAPAYYAAAPVVQILAAGVCIYSLHSFFSVAAVIKNKTWYLPISYLIAAILTVGLDYLLLPRFGYIAAAWVMVGAYTVFSASIYITLNRFYPVPYEFGRMAGLFLLALALLVINNVLRLSHEATEVAKQFFLVSVLPVFLLFGPFLRLDEQQEIVRFTCKFFPTLSGWYAKRRKIPT
jgi:O-antigen/teichoic acid export membrane protein